MKYRPANAKLSFTGKLKPYPAYKDSGVEWLGKVPAHWEVSTLKRIGKLQAGAGFPEIEQGDKTQQIPFFKVGDMGLARNIREMRQYQHTVSDTTARRLRAFVFLPTTIVFAKVGAALLLNRRRILVRPSCIDNNMMGFSPNGCDPLWAMYWLSGIDMKEIANPGAVPSVNECQMRETTVVIGPLPEQRAIAAFLDRETARIDALVAKKERLIGLLQEKRAALISRAVTKGLNPSAPMKESGVKWLGTIPAHWAVKRLKSFATVQLSNVNKKSTEGQDVVQLCNYVDVYYNERIDDRVDFMSATATKEQVRRFSLLSGDVLITKDSETWTDIAVPAVVSMDLPGVLCGYHLAHIRPGQHCNGGFLSRLFAAIGPRDQYHISANGITRFGLTGDSVRAGVFALPPPHEQRAIATFLDRETAKIDALVTKVREAIDRLKELRQALISAAVTGKIDVRDAV